MNTKPSHIDVGVLSQNIDQETVVFIATTSEDDASNKVIHDGVFPYQSNVIRAGVTDILPAGSMPSCVEFHFSLGAALSEALTYMEHKATGTKGRIIAIPFSELVEALAPWMAVSVDRNDMYTNVYTFCAYAPQVTVPDHISMVYADFDLTDALYGTGDEMVEHIASVMDLEADEFSDQITVHMTMEDFKDIAYWKLRYLGTFSLTETM